MVSTEPTGLAAEGLRIAEARVAAGYATQDAFGEAVGVSRTTVARWEGGVVPVPRRKRPLVARAANVEPEMIWKDTERTETVPDVPQGTSEELAVAYALDPRKLGARARTLRERLHLSLAQAGKRIGTRLPVKGAVPGTREAIGELEQIEMGRLTSPVPGELLGRIAKAYRVSLDELAPDAQPVASLSQKLWTRAAQMRKEADILEQAAREAEALESHQR